MLCEKQPNLLSCPPTRSFYEIAGLRVLNRFLSCKRLDGIELRTIDQRRQAISQLAARLKAQACLLARSIIGTSWPISM